jgi:hypothetical protein
VSTTARDTNPNTTGRREDGRGPAPIRSAAPDGVRHSTSDQELALPASTPEDPNGIHAASVLAAYCHAEQATAFRRLLWLRLAIFFACWTLFAVALLSHAALFVGASIAIGLGVYGAVAEKRANRTFGRLFSQHPTVRQQRRWASRPDPHRR